MHQRLKWILLVGASTGALATAPAAFAQSSGAAASRSDVLQEVVVTARRRDERLQDVPVAVTVVSGEDLKRQLIHNVTEVTQQTPSLLIIPSSQGPSNPQLTIRGQHVIENAVTLDPTVQIYFAEVVMQRPQGLNATFFDVSSVQVLKGPQGTLFGRGTTGGAMVITPEKPRLGEFEGEITAGLGNYDRKHGEFMLNLPVNDQLAVRLAGSSNYHSGYVKNLYDGTRLNNENNTSVRGSVLYKPTDAIENTLVAQYFSERNAGMAAQNRVLFATGAAAVFPQLRTQAAQQQAAIGGDFYSVFNDATGPLAPPGMRTKTWTVSNITTWQLNENITLKNVLGLRTIKFKMAIDGDGTAATVNQVAGANLPIYGSVGTLKGDQESEEFQILGNSFDNQLKWIVGAYAFREWNHDFLLTSVLPAFITNFNAKSLNKSWSVFAQGTYSIAAIPGLSVTGGLRETWDNRDNRAVHNSQPLTATSYTCYLLHANVVINPCYRNWNNYKGHALTYTASLDYKFTPDSLLYVTTRRGYRSGGLTLRARDDVGGLGYFRPEYVTDYELGFKIQDRVGSAPFRFNAAVYNQNYKDMQRQFTVTNPVTFFTETIVANAGKARIRGAEFDAMIQPTPMLELSAFFGYTDAKYLTFINPISGLPLRDNLGTLATDLTWSAVPKYSYGGTVRVNLPVDEAMGRMGVQANVYHQAHFRMSDLSSPGEVPAYTLVNLSADWRGAFGHPIDVRAFVKNLAKKKYYSSGLNLAALGHQSANIGDPQTWGFDLTYHF